MAKKETIGVFTLLDSIQMGITTARTMFVGACKRLEELIAKVRTNNYENFKTAAIECVNQIRNDLIPVRNDFQKVLNAYKDVADIKILLNQMLHKQMPDLKMFLDVDEKVESLPFTTDDEYINSLAKLRGNNSNPLKTLKSYAVFANSIQKTIDNFKGKQDKLLERMKLTTDKKSPEYKVCSFKNEQIASAIHALRLRFEDVVRLYHQYRKNLILTLSDINEIFSEAVSASDVNVRVSFAETDIRPIIDGMLSIELSANVVPKNKNMSRKRH